MEAVHKAGLLVNLSVLEAAHKVGAVRATANALEITLIIIHSDVLPGALVQGSVYVDGSRRDAPPTKFHQC